MCFSPRIQQGHWLSVTVLFLPGKRCQLPAFVLCSLGHTAVSPSPGLLPSSVLSRSTRLSFSEGVLQVVFSDSRNRHCFCCTHWTTAGQCKLQNPSPASPVKATSSDSGKSSDNALQQTPTRNTLRLFSLAHLYCFNQRGPCTFKWELTANTGILFSIFLFCPHTKNTGSLGWAISNELSFKARPLTHFFLPATPKLLSTWCFTGLLKHSLKKQNKKQKNQTLLLLQVQKYSWTHFRSYKTNS